MTNSELKSVEIIPNFKYHEFFPRWMCENYTKEMLDGYLDRRILKIIHQLRASLNKSIIINDWFWGGKFEWRGFRTPDSRWYSAGSAHSFGQAVDHNVEGMTVPEVHQYIKDNEDIYMSLGLTRIEHELDAPTWNHFDVKFTGKDHIHFFRK